MKPTRNLLITALLALTALAAVTYTACNRNHCSNVICLNRGICDGGTCYCPVGFEGARCEVLSRTKFIFTYNGHDICSNDSAHNQYPIHLLAVTYDSIELTMKNFLNNPDDSAICTMQSVDSFSFSGANNSTSYTGTGRLSNDSLWLHYSVIHDTTSFSCTYLGGSLR